MKTNVGTATAAVASVTLLVLVGFDLTTPHISLVPLYPLSPLIACSVLPPARTAAFAVLAFAIAVLAHPWNDEPDFAQHVVRLVEVFLVSGAAVLVAAVRIHREDRIRRLTTLAEVAQRAVLPVLPAHARRTDIAYRYESATEDAVIGGDLYDCYHSRTHTRFLIGDVRGKGLAAVEQSARVIRAFRQAAGIHPDLEEVVEDMNDYLTGFFDDEEFVTALLLDTTDVTRPRLVCAGHPSPLLVRPDGTSEFLLTVPDLPLGLGDHYRSHPFEWQPGDRLLLYTDGLSEARDSQGAFLDLRELAPLLARGPIEEVLDHALAAVRSHVHRGELSDDAAVILLEHTPTGVEYLPEVGEHDWRSSLPR